MSNPATGGPAFPVHAESHNRTNGQLDGMTLRDYFIAHAPTVPPVWFRPQMPPMPEQPRRPANLTPAEREELSSFDADYMRAEDTSESRVKAWLQTDAHWRGQARAWRDMSERETLLQWPAYWADEQLKRRAQAHANTEPRFV